MRGLGRDMIVRDKHSGVCIRLSSVLGKLRAFGGIFLGFLAVHGVAIVLICLAQLFRQFKVFGMKVTVSYSALWASCGAMAWNYLFRFTPFAVTLSVPLAFLWVMGEGDGRRASVRHLATFGVLSYILFSVLLMMARPGFLGYIPVLRTIPYLFCYGIGFLGLSFLIRKIHGGTRVRAGVVVLLVGLIFLPHDLIRTNSFSHGRPVALRGGPNIIVSVDCGRLDDVRSILSDARVTAGLSHYQSTRKQWEIMLGVPPERLVNTLFVPTLYEAKGMAFRGSLGGIAQSQKHRMAFLIDNGGTANQFSMDLAGFSDVRVSGPGVWQTGFPYILPVAGWLDNMVSKVESNNSFSDLNSLFKDGEAALGKNSTVFLHSCYLEQTLSSFKEYWQFDGASMIIHSPYHYVANKSAYRFEDCVLMRNIAKFKTKLFLEKANDFFRRVERNYPDYSGLLISDHGQDYGENSSSLRPGIHGFSSSVDCAWIPIVPYGQTAITSGNVDSPITWLDLNEAVQNAILKKTSLSIAHHPTDVFCEFPFIVPPPDSRKKWGDGVLDSPGIGLNIIYYPKLGIVYKEVDPISGFKKSYLIFSVGSGLYTINPLPGKNYEIMGWNGYSQKSTARVSVENIQKVLEDLRHGGQGNLLAKYSLPRNGQ